MKKLNVLASIGCAALVSYGVVAHAGDSVTLAAGGGTNKFTVQFVSKVGNTWTYTVSQTGRALSHWSLGIENCEGKVSNPSPSSGFESGQGGASDNLLKNTGVDWMIKWGTGNGVSTSGTTFSFTLDGDYESTDIGVLVKTGGNPQSAVGFVTGPDCSKPVTEEPPVEEPTADCSDEAYAAANPEECTVTYGDDNAAVIKIWKYVGSMSVEEFDATFKEGVDYVITGTDGDYLLQGIDGAGTVSSTVGATLK